MRGPLLAGFFGSPAAFTKRQMLDSLHFLLASNQYSGLDRQVVGVSVKGLEGREIRRQVGDDELKEVTGML